MGEAFLYKKSLSGAKVDCKASWPKIANGIVFSLLTSTVILMAMAVGALMMSVLYIFVLHGIRGDLALADSGVLVGQTVLAGVTLELAGKTEDDPDR
jgi:hypothetical protein